MTSTTITEPTTTARCLPPEDGAAILENARRIAPVLRAHAAAVEDARQLTPPVVEALRDSGVFRMFVPRAWGGPEVPMLEQLEIIETLARADGSAGWCAMIGSDSGFYASYLEDGTARELYPDLDAVTAGWIFPAGRLDPAEGGYRLSGRWAFGSGSNHADVFSAGALVMDGDAPRIGPDGMPEHRVALLPAAQVEVHDTWRTTGLCGSGSHDYSIDDVFVPAGRTFAFDGPRRPGTVYGWRGHFAANLVAVPIGIAAEAVDVAMGTLAGKLVMPGMTPASDDPRVRAAVAQAHATVGAARSYARDVLGDVWATLEAGDTPSLAQRGALAGSWVHTITTCRDAVGLLADVVGSASVQRGSALERHRRDLITIGQHVMAQAKMREWAGGLWFGQPAPFPVV